jgi:glycosyltransferase involved in cell wall biosynthesis
MDIHDIGPEFYMRRIGVGEDHPVVAIIKFIEKISTRFSDHVITVTDLWRNRLIARSTTPSKCTTLLNVPDDELFKRIPKDNCRTSNSFNLYYHGSIEELFGVDTLIYAMPTIVKKIQNVKLHIYGGGRLLESCNELVEKFGINEFVYFHNSIPFGELPQILSQADIGIVPTKGSVFADEILAMKSLEYISLGIPIIISKTKGHSYYYDSSMVKFFKPGDKDDLAKAVIELYTNENKRKMLKTQSRLFIEKFGWQNTKNTYIQIVKNLIN